jgi:hypothetical protein
VTDTPPTEQLIPALAESRAARRRFLIGASRTGLALGTVALLDACGGSNNGTATPTPTDTTTASPSPTATSVINDQNALNFLINIEYLTAQFYAAATATPLAASLLTGTGVQGAVVGGRAVTFTDPLVAQYARELAADDLAHIGFLRSILGSQVVAQPAINIDGGASGAFSKAMADAGVVSGGTPFDPYASDENFLLAAYFLTDVAVTAYKGAGLLFTDTIRLAAVAGIMATEAYHAGLLRTTLYAKGATTPALRTNADLISNYRDSLDGTTDLDQGITGTATASNITPADANGFAFTRTAGQALNIFYLNHAAVVGGGFFPNGMNGVTITSAAS